VPPTGAVPQPVVVAGLGKVTSAAAPANVEVMIRLVAEWIPLKVAALIVVPDKVTEISPVQP